MFEYSAGSNGNVTPSATISGGNTGLMSPIGIAEHAGGDIYVADSVAVSVLVFSAGSNGNISPAATISGAKTGLEKPLGIALDSSLNIYVTNSGPSVTVYSDGSSGNVSPIATIEGDKTDLDGPIGVTLDSDNKIYVVDEASSSVTIYPALGDSTGTLNEAPSAAISTTMTTGLTHPQEIALDSNGNIYVADDFASSLFIYPAGSNGNAVPTAIISGGTTNLTSPYGIALDTTGNIYVADYGLRLGATPASVFVYPPIANSTWDAQRSSQQHHQRERHGTTQSIRHRAGLQPQHLCGGRRQLCGDARGPRERVRLFGREPRRRGTPRNH